MPVYSLAPLAGISDWPFRLLCFEQGADTCVTEMISAQGYIMAPKNASNRMIMELHPDEGPVTAQLFGHDPGYMYEAARRISDLGVYHGIDINMGCPAPKVTNGGSGSALMKTPHLGDQVIRAVKKGTLLPVSVKMRIGWDEHSVNAVPFALMAQEAGADLLTVHGRTRSQQYAGRADWQTIAQVKQAVDIPVIANGDVSTPDDAQNILAVTGCDGVAIGRGALGRPWLFRQIKHGGPPPGKAEILAAALRHARMMVEWKGEDWAIVEMRKHFAWYLKGLRGAAQVRAHINRLSTLSAVEDVLATFLSQPDD